MKSPTKDATISRPVGSPAPIPAPIPPPVGPPPVIGPAAANPAQITGTMPKDAPAGAALEIDGMNFENVQHVFIGGIDVQNFTVMSSTVIKTFVPSQLSPGVVIIQVQTILDDGSIATSPGFNFTVDQPKFTFTGFTPSSGLPGDKVSLFGTGFSRLKSVTFNRAAPIAVPPVVVVSDTVATVIVPADAQTGILTISDGPDNLQVPMGNQVFTILPQPYVFDEPDEFDPKQGIIGTLVTIHGKHLRTVTTVSFNKVVSPNPTTGANQQIEATVPQGATTGPITLSGPNGSVTSQQNFVVILPPELKSVSPSSAAVGTKLTLTGKKLAGVSSAVFTQNGTSYNAQPPVVKDEHTVKVTVPSGLSSGSATITVQNQAGSASIGFTVTK